MVDRLVYFICGSIYKRIILSVVGLHEHVFNCYHNDDEYHAFEIINLILLFYYCLQLINLFLLVVNITEFYRIHSDDRLMQLSIRWPTIRTNVYPMCGHSLVVQ